MKSLIRPKRIRIQAVDGAEYSFLCKPEDDLRKDARLMDFFTVINKLLKADTSSRQRKLRAFFFSKLTSPVLNVL